MKKKEEKENAPNVAFVGKEWRKDKDGEIKLLPMLSAPEEFNTATKHIKIASSEVQVSAGAKGFYDENADWLLRQYPAPKKPTAGVFYKRPQTKGE